MNIIDIAFQGSPAREESCMTISHTRRYSDARVEVNFNDAMIILSDIISDWDTLTPAQKRNIVDKAEDITFRQLEDEMMRKEENNNEEA